MADSVHHNVQSLLSSPGRDFLLRNNADQVQIESLKGKKLGFYFSASWCGPCRRFTPTLVEVYNELSPNGDFEVVFVSADEDDEAFNSYFSKMPWLAIPFSDSETRKRLNELFHVHGIPHLTLLDETGNVVAEDGVGIIRDYGAEGYPFTSKRVQELKDQEEEAKRNQSLRSLLVSRSRDFVISSNGNKIPISELEGKTVGLYFFATSYRSCALFTQQLKEVYEKLKTKGENFEVVFIPLDDEEESFKEELESVPWLSLPLKDKTCAKLIQYFELSKIPTLVIIGPDGKTLHTNVVEAIEDHGIDAYPFTPEKFVELNEIAKAKEATQTLESVLVSGDQNFVIKNDGEKVKIDSLEGKKLGFYFSASWCGPCRRFTPKLVEVYNKLSPNGDFEVIFVSADKDDEAFKSYFSKMPWLAIPFSDTETRKHLNELFHVNDIPHLTLFDENGNVVAHDGVGIIRDYGAEGYPFTLKRVQELKDKKDEKAKRNQSLRLLLVSRSRDFVISSDGNKIPISELEGKTVGLYFFATSYRSCTLFTQQLKEVYEKLKTKGEKFEVVLIPVDDEEESFKEELESVPWLSLPLKDKTCAKLIQYFELSEIPTLVIIGPDGKTLHPNVAEAVADHGIDAFPFTPEKFVELDEIAKAREGTQTLESVLVSGDKDFVIKNDGAKIPVSKLTGKTILLYFSAHWCHPCGAFLPKLIDAYHKIKAQDNDALEVVFISSDTDQNSFDEFFARMPWLALPFGDSRNEFLSRKFKVSAIPMLVAIGPSGQTVTKEARDLVGLYGADAYPFTELRIKEMEAKNDEIAKGWPEKVTHEAHEHELVLSRCKNYHCDDCNEEGHNWSYFCEECDFDLHPNCALGDKGSM
ncbi:protein-disulfide reductase [Trifolium repens]|nr:protein-disulfide reductase [Trifolium repens]